LCREGVPFEALALESEPIMIALEVGAYRKLLLRQRVNGAGRGAMVAFQLWLVKLFCEPRISRAFDQIGRR
jgi:hypothetical protein